MDHRALRGRWRALSRGRVYAGTGQPFRRFEWSLEQLRIRNVAAREPLVRHVEGKIWELRETSDTNAYRVLYVFFTGRRIVLLHGIAKKTRALPRRDLEIAARRLRRFEERERGDD